VTFDILVVCTGNICRSPLAERLLAARLEGNGDFRVSSAGIHGLDQWEMDESAAAELRRLGGDATGFTSRRLREVDAANADLVLTADRDHRSAVLALAPEALRRTFTLREFAHLAEMFGPLGSPAETVREYARRRGEATISEYDVDDPYRQGVEEHRAAAEAIDAAVRPIVEVLTAPARR
jgi:protein-tyrosine phosphatase